MTHDEMAEVLGIPVGTVRSRLIDGWCEGAGSLWEIEDVGGGTADMGLTGPCGTMRVLIVGVNDDRIVIAATVRGAATMADTAGLREVLESLEIEVP